MARGERSTSVIERARQSKVGNHGLPPATRLIPKHNIRGLHVSMDESPIVHLTETTRNIGPQV